MSEQKNYDTKALLALPKVGETATPEKGLLSWSRPYLIDQIRQHGVDVEVVRGVDSIDAGTGSLRNVTRPEYLADGNVRLEHVGEGALHAYGVMRTIVRSVGVDHIVPVLNPTALRQHARSKHAAAEELLRPAGAYQRAFQLVEPSGVTDGLDALSGDAFVAKPNVGRMSRNVKVGDRQAIIDHVTGQEVPFLVEEKIDFTAAFPGIKGIDEDQQTRLDEANRLGVNKELRMYYFGDGTWDSVVRAARPGETDFRSDEWLYVDLDTIPDEIYTMSAAVIDRIKRRVGTDEVNIALDYVYGSTASRPDPHWEVMELNVNEPQLVQEYEHTEVGRRQHGKLATQIARIAVS